MTTTETVTDVEVDESELTQQPCETQVWTGKRCGRPSVGEDLMACENGHERHVPCCERHLGRDTQNGGYICAACRPSVRPVWVVVSRYYTRPAR